MGKSSIIRRVLIVTIACLLLMMIALFVLNSNLARFTVTEHEAQVVTPTEPFDSVNVQSPDLDVLLSASEDGVCRISIPQSKSFIYETTIENGALNVVKVYTAPWYVTLFDSFGRYEGVRIELPEKDYAALTVQVRSGNVVVGENLRFDSAGIRLNSGNLDFRGAGGELNLSASSGNLCLRGVAAKEIALQTASGNIDLTDVQTEGLRTLVTSGNTKLDRVNCATLNAKGKAATAS